MATGLRSVALRMSSVLALAVSFNLQAEQTQEARAAEQAKDVEPAQTMRGIKVEAAEDGATTEHSGSYTTGSSNSATKLPLSLRETPQSVTVITRQRIEDAALTNIADVLNATPGITVQENDSSRTGFSARGFSITNFQADGMPVNYGSYVTGLPDMASYDRVEVVRGSTGLLTGAGDPSATVNLVRKRPTRDFQASMLASAGSWDMYRVEGDVAGPLLAEGRVRGRVVVAQQEEDSFRDYYHEKNVVAYGAVEVDITERTLATLSIDYVDFEPRGTTWGTTPLYFNDGSLANLPRSFNPAAKWSSWSQQTRTWQGAIEHRLGEEWRVKTVVSERNSLTDGKLYFGGSGYPDPDGTGLSAWYGYFPYEERQRGVDVMLAGPFQLFGRRHDVVLGWNGWKREGETPALWTPTLTPTQQAAYTTIPNYWEWSGDVPEFTSLKNGNRQSLQTTEQSGGYAAVRFRVFEPLAVIGGARISSWKTRTDNYNPTTGAFTNVSGVTDNSDVVTPYGGVVFDVSEHFSLYASYAEMFKAQSYKDKNNEYIDPVAGTTYEAGVKGEFYQGGLNLSAAYFEATLDNVAELDPSVPDSFRLPDGSQAYVSTGKGNKTKGYELEVSGEVLPGWQVASGYTHRRTRNPAGVLQNTIQPEDIFRLWTSWRPDFAGQRLSLGAGVNWQSEIWTLATAPNPNGSGTVRIRAVQDSYALVDLMAGFRLTDTLQVSLNGKNVLDKTYFRRVGFYNGGYYGEPRSILLSVRSTF